MKARVLSLLGILLLALGGIWWFGQEDQSPTTGPNPSEEAQGTASQEAAAAPEEGPQAQGSENAPTLTESADQEIERLNQELSVALIDEQGQPVIGRVIGLELTPHLQKGIDEAAHSGRYLWQDDVCFDGNTEADGICSFPQDTPVRFLIILADGYEPQLLDWQGGTPDQPFPIPLTSVEPLRILVLNPDEQPIEGAEVFTTGKQLFQMDRSLTTYERLQGLYFKSEGITGPDGRITFPQCFRAQTNNVRLWADDFLAADQVHGVAGGTEVVMRCRPACVVRGQVQLAGEEADTGNTETSVRLWAFVDDEWRGLNGAFVKEDGSYFIESVSVDVPTIMAACVADGFGSQQQVIPLPQPGKEYHLDFTLQPGLGGQLTFLTEWGEPVPGAGLKFEMQAGVATLFFYQTNADGSIEVSEVLPKDIPLDLRLTLAGGIGMILTDRFQGGEQAVVVPDLTRITQVDVPAEILGEATIAEAYWMPNSPALTGICGWYPAQGPSPLVTAGLGILTVILDDGRVLESRLQLEDGPESVIQLKPVFAELRFAFPADLPTNFEIYSHFSTLVHSAAEVTGEVALPCQPGGYILYYQNAQGFGTLSGIEVPASGKDLGLIEGVDSGEIWGTVTDRDGQPLPSVSVSLSDAEAYESWAAYTDAEGAFSFGGVPPGLRYLYLSNEKGYGPNGGSLVHEVFVPPGGSVGPVQLEFASAQRVTGKTDGTDIARLRAILIGGTGLLAGDVTSSGSFSLPAIAGNGWLGLSGARVGESWLVAQRIPSGPGEFFLSLQYSKELAIEVVDEAGRPWNGLTVRMELAHHAMPYRTMLDPDGRLLLHTWADLPLTLSLRRPDGTEERVALNTADASQKIVLPRSTSWHPVAIERLDGGTVAGAVISTADLRQTFRLGSTGVVEVPAGLQGELQVAAPGYLTVPIPPDANRVRLPRRLSDVTVGSSVEGAITLEWTTVEEYIDGFVLSGSGAAPADGAWMLGNMPEGAVHFRLLDAAGKELFTGTRRLSEQGQQVEL